MWFVFGGFAAILYVVLIITLGVTTLRNGHGFMFVLGFFMPLFWLFGALSQPRTQAV